MSTTAINSTSDANVVSATERVQSELVLLTARLRRDVWLYGVLVVLATVVGMLLATVVFDAIFRPESIGARFGLWIPVLAASGVAAYRFIWCPLRDRCNTLALAWSLDEHHTEFQEGLTSTLLLARSSQPAAASLVDAVADQASRNLADCGDDVVTRRDFRRPGFAAAICVMVTASCFAGWPQYLMPSFSNVMAPWNARQLPHLTSVISPGHIAIAEDEALEVSALGHDLSLCTLEIMNGSEAVSSIPMAVTANGNEAIALLSGLCSDQAYRVRSGSLVSDVYQITVHPRPVVTQAKATLEFPEYTGMKPETIDELSLPIAAIPGTHVRLSIATSIPNCQSDLTLDAQPQDGAEAVHTVEELWHHWDLITDTHPVQSVSLDVTSDKGVPGEPLSIEIHNLRDKPPTISIKTPSLQRLAVQPDGKLSIQFDAADDFGLQFVAVFIQAESAEPVENLVAQNLAVTSHSAEYVFDPQLHKLEDGGHVTLWFVAADNRTPEYGGAQTTESRRLVIAVSDGARSVGRQRVIDEESQFLESLSDAMDHLRQANETAQRLSNATQQDDAGDGDQAATNVEAQMLQEQLRDAHQSLEQLADSDEEDDTGLFKAEKQQVRDITEKEVEEAQHQARMIPLVSDVHEQQQNAAAAHLAIEKAEEQLAMLKEQIVNRSEKLQQAAELDELARQQNELARQLEEREQAPEQVEERQEKIAEQLQELVEDDPEAESEQFLQRANAAEQLAERTAELHEQQRRLTKAARPGTDKETRRQLTEMIRKEQQAIADENQQLMNRSHLNETNHANADPAADAQQLMNQVTKDLAGQSLQAAEQNAKKAKQQLQQAAGPQEIADARKREQLRPGQTEDRDRLAERQQRIEDAIRAVKEDEFETAANALQELVTDRLEQVAKEAEALLELPTDDEENQQAGNETKQKLQMALKDSKQASARPQDQKDVQSQQQARGQDQRNNLQRREDAEQGKAQPVEQQQQPGQPGRNEDQPQAQNARGQKNDPVEQQNETGQKSAPQQQEQAVGQEQVELPEQEDRQPQTQQAGDQKKGQPADPNEAGRKGVQPQPKAEAGQQKAGQQAQPDGRPGQQKVKTSQLPDKQMGDQQQQQAAKKNEAGSEDHREKQRADTRQQQPEQKGEKQPEQGQPNDSKRQPGDQQANSQPQNQPNAQQQKSQQKSQQEQQEQQQNKAAQSLRKATDSLQQFCKSCRKCANCNKPGQGRSSAGKSSRPGNKQSGEEPGNGRQSGQKQPSPAKQLAQASDNAQNAARNPAPGTAKQLAKELDRLAEQAAQKSGYRSQEGNKGESGNGKNETQQRQTAPENKDGSPDGRGSSSSVPMGVGRDSQPDDASTMSTQLRGPSSSEWTRSHNRLRGNVLDSKSAQIPEAYRRVVEAYFLHLSEIESNHVEAEEVK